MTLELVALPLADAIAIAEDDMSFYAHAANADVISELLGDAAAAQADLYEQTNAQAPWVGYLAYDVDANEIVGICTFKDMPEDGMVEIAFYTFPDYEGEGWGTAMAAAQIVSLVLMSGPSPWGGRTGAGPSRAASRPLLLAGVLAYRPWCG